MPNFEQKHPLLIGALYWFSGLFAHSFPISSCSLIALLVLFTPQNKLYKQLFWYFLWILAACCFSYSPPHQGYVYGSFVITQQYKHKKHHIYQVTASFIMPCCNKKTTPLSCRIQSNTPLSKEFKYTAQGYLAKQNSLFIFTPTHIEKAPLSKGHIYKQSIRNYLQQTLTSRFSDTQCADFASSIILGTPLPESLSYLFRQKRISSYICRIRMALFFIFSLCYLSYDTHCLPLSSVHNAY